jgi:beta-glucosidase/6-phospho-beta-glucosidase/beta-galactosidase
MKSLGVSSYRFSLSWPRLIPRGYCTETDCEFNPDGMRFYTEIFEQLKLNEITPYVTLYHWDLPSNLRNCCFHVRK